MAKDPAFLFYSNDFLAGTFTLTDEQVGKYIRLLCLQHQKYILTKKDMINICKTYDEDIYSKFIQQGDNYYNLRLREEAEKRKAYSESRRKNRTLSLSYDKHMENEDENVIKDKDKNDIKKIHLFSSSPYYPLDKFSEKFCSNLDYQKFDVKYYYESVRDWSEANNKRKANWITTAYTWARKDEREGKPHYKIGSLDWNK
jgi:hypothetical protein